MTPVEIHPYPEHISLEIEDEIVRYIPVSANISGEPAHGYEKRNVSVIPDRMEVIGPRSIIEDINALLTEKIDITDISDNFSSDVAISTINEYLHFKNDTIVSIKVNVAPVETTASFKGIPVIFENLPPDVNMKDVTYNVDVGVRGAMLVLEKLKASSFIASADCSSAVVPGEKFDVPVIIFSPENVRVVSQSRKTVNIEILQEGAVQTGDLIWEPYED